MRRAGEKAARLLASGQPSTHCSVQLPRSTRKAKKAPPATDVAVAEIAREIALKTRANRRRAMNPLNCLVVSMCANPERIRTYTQLIDSSTQVKRTFTLNFPSTVAKREMGQARRISRLPVE